MSLPLFRKLLHDARWPLLFVCLFLAGFETFWAKFTERIAVEIVPALAKLGPLEKIAGIFFSGSGKLVQTLMGGETIALDRVGHVLTIGYVHPLIQFVLAIWAVGRASGALAGEMDRGTMELLLAQPLSRRQVVLTQLAVDLATIPVICLAMLGGTHLGVWLVGLEGVDLTAYHGALVNVAALLFALTGITMAFSAAGRSRWRVMGAVVGLLLILFLLNIIGQLWDTLGPWRALSVFYYYQPQPIALQGKWTVPVFLDYGAVPAAAVPTVPVLVALGALGYAVALWTFTKRDLPAPL